VLFCANQDVKGVLLGFSVFDVLRQANRLLSLQLLVTELLQLRYFLLIATLHLSKRTSEVFPLLAHVIVLDLELPARTFESTALLDVHSAFVRLNGTSLLQLALREYVLTLGQLPLQRFQLTCESFVLLSELLELGFLRRTESWLFLFLWF